MHEESATLPGGFDLRSLPSSFYDDPYPVYQAQHRSGPIQQLPSGDFFVTGHDLARQIYRNAAAFSSNKRVQFEPAFGRHSPLFEHHTTSQNG